MSDKHVNQALRVAMSAYIEALLPQIIGPIREIAHDHGYAIAVHGSLARDIDLVAVPWIEHAKDADKLVESIKGAIAGVLGRCCIAGPPTEFAHGRRAWVIHIPDLSYIDLSVMPKTAPPKGAAP